MEQEQRTEMNTPDEPAGWSVPRPDRLPRPTYAPAGAALGAAFLVWGILTSFVITIVGLLIFVVSIAAWIREILRER